MKYYKPFKSKLESLYGAVNDEKFVSPRYNDWIVIKTESDFKEFLVKWGLTKHGLIFRPEWMPYAGGSNA